MASFEAGKTPEPLKRDRRVCAFQHSYAHLCENNPNCCLLTFDFSAFRYYEQLLLCKLRLGLCGEWVDEVGDNAYTCENVPGGLFGRGLWKGQAFTLECYPFVNGRGPEREGGMALRIKAEGQIRLQCSAGGLIAVLCEFKNSPEGKPEPLAGSQVSMKGGTALFTHAEHPLTVAAMGNCQPEDAGEGTALFTAENELLLSVSFAETNTRATELAAIPADRQIAAAQAYYDTILQSWYCKTPSPALDEAFTHARLNVEYGWFRPFGWVEALHHWVSMWHMEHTDAENWAGNAERSRELLQSQLERLLEGDQVPELYATGAARREWGGDNHYFFRCVRQYLLHTGDTAFAKNALPFMKKILAQTLRQYDTSGTGVMGFGTQLGNQEDFEGTPGAGAATGLEAAIMHSTLSLVAGMAGEEQAARKNAVTGQWIEKQVINRFWMADVGRLAWYEDAFGSRREEPAYHALCYPIINGQFTDRQAWSSVDHLLNRLTGPQGEMYLCNHFGGHCYHGGATWGMQCGANMQYFASRACAGVGRAEDALRPLQFVADLVCGPVHKGGFPETANETLKGYFTPAAATFAKGVIESIFGLSKNAMERTFTLSPCFPKSWQHAELRLPEVHIEYKKAGNEHCFTGSLPAGYKTSLVWRLPPYAGITAACNGCQLSVSTTPRAGYYEARAEFTEENFVLTVKVTPILYSVAQAPATAEGETVDVLVSGATLRSVEDPSGLFSETVQEKYGAKARLRTGLLAPYERYGWFGLQNFARRTVFLHLQAGDRHIIQPFTVTVLPQLAVQGEVVGAEVKLTACPLAQNINGTAHLLYGGTVLMAEAELKKGETGYIYFPLPSAAQNRLLPGRNQARLLLGGQAVTLQLNNKTEFGEDKIKTLPLPEALLKPPAYWGEIGKTTPPGSTLFCVTPDSFLTDVFEKHQTVRAAGVTFHLNKNGFVPVSSGRDRVVTLPLRGVPARKLFVLFCPFITNQHAFSEVFRFELEAEQGESYCSPVYIHRLCFPGDLDIGLSGRGVYGFPTFVEEEPRGGLPPLPGAGQTDYPAAFPPAYPQHSLWSNRPALQVEETVFTVVEMELDIARPLRELRIFVQDAHAAGAVYALAAAV